MKELIIPFYHANKTLKKSKDCILYDDLGKKYIDFESGVWCANLGHNPKSISKAIKKQLKKTIHHGSQFKNKESEELALLLNEKCGFKNGQSVFLSSGSEAIQLALSLSLHLKNKEKILKISNTYLSAYGYGKISDKNQNLILINANDFKALESLDFSEIAAIAIELGGASLDIVSFPKQEFISKLQILARKNDCIIIVDEVTTGFGRMGFWFAFQKYKINPDIVVSGKALGNGFPISAVSIQAKIADQLKDSLFSYYQSHQNDPLGCSIAIAVIKEIQKKHLIERSYKIGIFFKNKLAKLQEAYPHLIKELRAKALMLALEFQDKKTADFIYEKLSYSGFIVGYKKNTFRFMPPLTIKKSHIISLCESIEKALIKIK